MKTVTITPDQFNTVIANSFFLLHENFPENLPYEIGRTDDTHYICTDWKAWRQYVTEKRSDPKDTWHPNIHGSCQPKP
jgi:hypothetical protein